VVSASDDGTVKVWDAAGGRESQTFPGRAGVAHVTLLRADASRVALFSGDDRVTVYDARAGRALADFRMAHVTPGYGSLHPGGELFAVGSGLAGPVKSRPGSVKVWDIRRGVEVCTLPRQKGGVAGVNFSPDGKWLASVSGEGELKVWEVGTWKLMQSIDVANQELSNVAFSPDGRRLLCLERKISGGKFVGRLAVWDSDGHGRWGNRRTFPEQTVSFLPDRPFSRDGRLLAVACSDYRVKVLEARTGAEVHTLRGHKHMVIDAAFSPDGKRLATASLDRSVIVWDTATGQQTLTLRGHSDGVVKVMWDEGGNRLTSCGRDGEVKIWSAAPLPGGNG
jgi:WD40 repeat protein